MRGAAILATAVLLAACSKGPPAPRPVETEVPKDLATPRIVAPVEAVNGTPMKDRVAVIGVLNKRNNLGQDFEMKPGEARRWGNVIVRLAACERTAPWEFPRQTGAFAQVFVQGADEDGNWAKIFSGWLFKETPSLNVVEHPIYDVWVKDCRMSFAGDKAPPEDSDSSAAKASGNDAGPEPSPAPSPAATASPSNAT